ncbi:hypothetical protein [Methylobacterium radiotolerans]|uniref:hypothetical protein n=1 Tax=Methylobacterium radiotolerans TaxID=31998 RepID=UPI001FD8E6A4|nr:hypothetical protein [Methylobacterium radiotolerans]
MEIRLSEAKVIALAYHRSASGDAWAALVRALEEALTDLQDAEAPVLAQGWLISRGYARCHAGTA